MPSVAENPFVKKMRKSPPSRLALMQVSAGSPLTCYSTDRRKTHRRSSQRLAFLLARPGFRPVFPAEK